MLRFLAVEALGTIIMVGVSCFFNRLELHPMLGFDFINLAALLDVIQIMELAGIGIP